MRASMRRFAEEMTVIMPRLMREFLRRQARVLTTWEISFAQLAVLHLLKERGSCKMTEIAKFFSISTSAATGLVDRMTNSKLLRRVRDHSDRRIVNILLTSKGRKTVETIFKQRQKMMMGIFEKFTPEEREIYLGTVKKMYNIMVSPVSTGGGRGRGKE